MDLLTLKLRRGSVGPSAFIQRSSTNDLRWRRFEMQDARYAKFPHYCSWYVHEFSIVIDKAMRFEKNRPFPLTLALRPQSVAKQELIVEDIIPLRSAQPFSRCVQGFAQQSARSQPEDGGHRSGDRLGKATLTCAGYS